MHSSLLARSTTTSHVAAMSAILKSGAQSSHPLFATASKLTNSSLRTSFAKSLGNVPQTKVTKLSNGLTVASETNKNYLTATVGCWINAGSRNETAENNGTAHFLEHLAFKGTKSRTQQQLESEIENMGGHLNAYTSREQTVYYAKTLSKDIPNAVGIISDILQGSTLAPDAIEREREVILREAEEVEKSKEEVVFDHLHASAFQGNPLGRTILGSTHNIKSIQRNQLVDFIEKNYTPNNIVLAAAGNVDHDALVKLAEQNFGHLKPSEVKAKLTKPRFIGSDVRARFDDHPTAHVALAVEGASWTSPDYWALLVAQSIVGSWDRSLGASSHVSSKLAKVLYKEELANSFMSFNTSYADTGLFGIYAVSENKMQLDDLVHYIQQEWHRLCMNVSEIEVTRAKNQLKTTLLLGLDGTTAIAEDIGRNTLNLGKRLTPWEIDGLIEGITAQDVMRVAGQYIYDRELVLVGYGPVESLPDYNRTRSAMSPTYY